MSEVLRLSLLLLPLLLVASCAHHRTIDREALRSELISAISVANEAEISIDYVAQGRVSNNFATGHFKYVADQIKDSAEELDQSAPKASIEGQLQTCRTQMNALADELLAVRFETRNLEALATSQMRIAAIRKVLEAEYSSL
jgi:hypothetical protein